MTKGISITMMLLWDDALLHHHEALFYGRVIILAKEIKRFPLRVPLDDYNHIRVIAFNCRISINRTIGYLLAASLSDERIVDRLYAAHPPGKDQFIYIKDGE